MMLLGWMAETFMTVVVSDLSGGRSDTVLKQDGSAICVILLYVAGDAAVYG